MAVTKVSLKNITVFDALELSFSGGIEVFLGVNGVGKTHVMKLLYSACQAADPKTSFSHKLVRCFWPDDHRIARLIRKRSARERAVGEDLSAVVRVTARTGDGTNKVLTASFHDKTQRWNADVTGEDGWEKQLDGRRSIFIPAKEILSHAYNLNAAVAMNNVSFDDTYLDVIDAAKIAVSPGRDSAVKKQLLDRLEMIVDGKVSFDPKRDEFYLRKGNTRLEFNLVAEGVRKIALLWQLAKNGVLMDGSVLFWDEPESNIDPVNIPVLADFLLELQRNGVQIFLSTHDYFLAKYLELERKPEDKIQYHSFYLDGPGGVRTETSRAFTLLEHNSIMETFVKLYEAEVDKEMRP